MVRYSLNDSQDNYLGEAYGYHAAKAKARILSSKRNIMVFGESVDHGFLVRRSGDVSDTRGSATPQNTIFDSV